MELRLMNLDEINMWFKNELNEAFVQDEIKPLEDIMSLINSDEYEVWGLFDDKQMLGYATIWKALGIPLVLLDYLGVTRLKRNSGLGSYILSCLKLQGRPIVVESEFPIPSDSEAENNIRSHRIAFYERNGFIPVYEMATCGLRFQAFLFDQTGFALSDIMVWHKAIYGPKRTDVIVPIKSGVKPPIPYWMEQ